MTIPSVTYPLDLTGSHPTNLVRGEVHPVYPKTVQAIATTHGPFYVDSLVVVESSTGRRLEKDRDYFATELHAIPTNLSKKDVCSIVVLTDPLIAEFVSLTYQVVGDKYSDSDHALADLLNSIDFDRRSPSWPSPIVKSEDYSVSFRMQGVGNRYGFEYATQAIDRIRVALSQGNQEARQAVFEYLEAKFGSVPSDLAKRVEYAMRSAIAKHKKQPNPHGQYFRRDEKLDFDPVRTPINKTPANNAVGISNHTSITGNTYGSLYRAAHVTSHFQVSANPDMSMPLVDIIPSSAGVSYSLRDLLTPGTKYYWRLRYFSAENYWSDWSEVTSFTTVAGGMTQPAITTPNNNASGVSLTAMLVASAFALTAGADTHDTTDWEIWTGANGTGARVFSSPNNGVNKTSIVIPQGTLLAGTAYYPRVRYRGAQLGVTGWSNAVKFTTAGAGVNTPIMIEPVNNAVDQSPVLTLKSSAFATTNTTDTHASSSWEIWSGPDGTGTLIWNTYNNWQNKLSIVINEGALQPAVKYHARVRHHGTNVPNSSWSPSVAFTIRAAAPAQGTILDTRCEVYDRYNLVADGEYGSEWVLAEANSTSCGFNPARIAPPEWTSADNRTLGDRQGSINSFVNVFRVEYGSDTYVRTEWELYKAGTRTLNGSLNATNLPVTLTGTSQLDNHSVYKLRARFIGANLPASDWSSWLTINAEWPNSPAAGAVLRTFCSGYDKYEERSNGNYGSYNALVESNAGYCGYVVPFVVKPTITSPASGNHYGDPFAANGIYFNTTAFALGGTNPPGAFAASEYQILNGAGTVVVKEWTETVNSVQGKYFPGDLSDNTWYLVRMRHRSTSGQVSEWANAISMYINFTDAGTALRYYCDGTTKMVVKANGRGGEYGEVFQTNSTDCGYVAYPAAGTELRYYCEGVNRMVVKANGSGGEYTEVYLANSVECGYVAPQPYGTFIRYQCSGVDKHAVRANGSGGEYLAEVVEYNSAECGYVAPPASPAPLSPFGGLMEAHGTSPNNSASCAMSIYSNGRAVLDGSPQGSNESGDWMIGGVGADYDLQYSVTGHTFAFSASSNPNTWVNLADPWYGSIATSATSGGSNNGKSVTVNVTIRNNKTGTSVNFSMRMWVDVFVYEM